MFVPIILGTAREGRQSEKVAKYILKQVKNYGLSTELIDVRDFLISKTDNTKTLPQAKILEEKIGKANGLIIVAPEYNHSYPGELKLMLDMLYSEFAGKPLGICGVSAGPLGGGRMVEQLRLVSVELHMIPIREALYFPFVQNLFEGEEIKDPQYSERVKKFLDELTSYVK